MNCEESDHHSSSSIRKNNFNLNKIGLRYREWSYTNGTTIKFIKGRGSGLCPKRSREGVDVRQKCSQNYRFHKIKGTGVSNSEDRMSQASFHETISNHGEDVS